MAKKKTVNKKLAQKLLEQLRIEKPCLIGGYIYQTREQLERAAERGERESDFRAFERDHKNDNLNGAYCAIGWIGSQLGQEENDNQASCEKLLREKVRLDTDTIYEIMNNNDALDAPWKRRNKLERELTNLAEHGRLTRF